ncbi:ATP-binding protein [Rhodoferax sp. WC2427]|uniref:ATP-binding protein n=1 Tax=Rhodoferax sp. WC2427 TaxID=3234144 RepID=UPI0034650546
MSLQSDQIPPEFLQKWQDTINVMARIFDVPAGLMMRVLPEQIEVLLSSTSDGNPYEHAEKAALDTGLYCETVMATRDLLHVPNALDDPQWEHNPDVALNMISYLGVPLEWRPDEMFGTICVLDSKTRHYPEKYMELMWELKKSIEADFSVIRHNQDLVQANLLLAQEVKERQATELRLQAAQHDLAQAEKMAALGGLVAGIAHEINTPVGLGLTGSSHFKHMVEQLETKFRAGQLEEPDFEQFLADSKQLSHSIFISLEKAAALVKSFKLVAVDQTHDEMRNFQPLAYIQDLLLTHKQALRQAGVATAVDCQADLVVTSYPGAWSQVLSNLISNSLVHGFTPGQTDARIHIALAETPGEWVLDYRDNGRGMSDEVARKVFDPFFTTNRQGGGSGLGMHVVYNLVSQKLGGQIHLQTALGQGAAFTCHLPKQPASA